MSHIVESCPLTKLNGGLSRLHSADEDADSWLTSYGSWHAYEKKKNTDRRHPDEALLDGASESDKNDDAPQKQPKPDSDITTSWQWHNNLISGWSVQHCLVREQMTLKTSENDA